MQQKRRVTIFKEKQSYERRSMKISKELLMAMGVIAISAGVAMADDGIQA